MAYIVLACFGRVVTTCIVIPYTVMAGMIMACAVLAHAGMAQVGMAYIAMAYIVVAILRRRALSADTQSAIGKVRRVRARLVWPP